MYQLDFTVINQTAEYTHGVEQEHIADLTVTAFWPHCFQQTTSRQINPN